MTRTITLHRGGLAARSVAIFAAMALIVFGGVALTTSAGAQVGYPIVVPVEDTSAQTCASLGAILVAEGYLAEVPDWTQVKVDPPRDTTVGPFTVSAMDNAEPPSFDWSSTQPMNIVFVKSGTGASQIYLYDPATGATGGTGLTTANGKQISNIVACYGTFATTTTVEPTTTTVEPTTTTVEPTTTTVEPTTTTVEPTTTSSVLGTTTLPGSTTPVAPTAGAEVLGATQAPAVEALPYTGDETGWLAAGAAAVLLGGTFLVLLARRRLLT
ncbi:LPXTG cell wall anchor domain-containing protein [Rhabdothermincola salaria]|uniref:LPXTG cell wall anchor domain-containing protein n=1 Tax=Rhabdothermincola salaria TaxID=2903142 RepID=UPI001E2DDB5B|nr:LPXTG cell wall anchor domain-containing protein [Rhabdothermincola salaria]MCD9625193.1 LPXTG cell wall anchor domain-containing protein [Rhabdothermincola salaria]